MLELSQGEARRLVLRCQGLDGGWNLPPGKEGAAQVVERLGYVQIDTIAVVQRAHHHTLWARCPDYEPGMLHALQAQDRRVFEYWGHAASYLPMQDYRYSIPRMRAYANGGRTRAFLEANRELAAGILERIRSEGPLASSNFAAPEGSKRRGWWDWKPAKEALEALFSTGELMVTERRNFERVYDLPERVLPPGIDTTPPGPGEEPRHVVRRVLGNEGVSSLQHWWLRDRKPLEAARDALIDSGEVVRVCVEGVEGEHYAWARALPALAEALAEPPALHVLSPFDNLTIWRQRLKQLFGFDYKLECYQPEAKRQYGYFCLPVLWGDTFVARLDAKAERREKTLRVRKLFLEPGFSQYGALLPALAKKLQAFAGFNDCERVLVDMAEPGSVLEPLRRGLCTQGCYRSYRTHTTYRADRPPAV